MRKLGLIGAPSSAGARNTGQELAPAALRRAGLLEELNRNGTQVTDLGDLPLATFQPDLAHPRSQNLSLVCMVVKQVAHRIDQSMQAEMLPILIGGDCTITIGAVAGAVRHFPNLGLIYFDGDADMNTPHDTPSGILDGMVMAHILGEGAAELSRIGPRHPLLAPEQVVMFGYNMTSGFIDPWELAGFNSRPFIKFPVDEVRRKPEKATLDALSLIESSCDRFLLHFDVDVLDHDDFPAADIPHSSGLTLATATKALRLFFASRKFGGFILTEFNAARDTDGFHARRLVDTLATIINGESARNDCWSEN